MTEEPQEIAPTTSVAKRAWKNADWIALLVLLLLTSVLRFASLSDPPDMIFDEIYYAKDSCFYVLNDVDPCEVDGNQAEVHPPVGKWLIGIGIKAFGFDSFGWRFVPAIGGTLTVLLMYLIARKIFGSWKWAAMASGLLAIDPLHFVQSRTSMLDIFVPMFGLATLLFLLLDRDRILGADGSETRSRGIFDRPWRIAVGAGAGLTVATKWTGGFYLLIAVLLTVAWETASRHGPRMRAFWTTVKEEAASIALWLVALPIVIYVVSFAGQFQGKLLASPFSEGSWGRAFLDHHEYMWNFHTQLEATHGYASPPWTWILIKRPVSYFFCSGANCTPATPEGNYSEIFATGSPLVWWASIIAILGLGIVWVARRNYRSPEGLILAGIVFTYGPWLVPGAERPAVFLFYLLPTVPFMILALVYWMERIADTWEGKTATALFATGAVAVFAFYYPLLTKKSIPQPHWQKRIWVFDNCNKPPGATVTTTVTITENGEPRETTSETQDNSSLPPLGWCWI